MPTVQSKNVARVGAGAPLSALASLGLIVSAALVTWEFYLDSIQIMRTQCICCENLGLFSRECHNCQAAINCCNKCWPRYQREVHSLRCQTGENLDTRFTYVARPDRPFVSCPPPCRVCGRSAYTICNICEKVTYCDSIRQCAMTDWPRHRHECRPDIVQMKPNHGTKSTMESSLPVDLLAHIESFLSLFQWSQTAQVNHAWRNASLLPSSASNQANLIATSIGSANTSLGDYARRSLRRLCFTNVATAQVWISCMQSATKTLPYLSHLEAFTIDDPSHLSHRQGEIGEYVATMSSTLRQLDVPGEIFSSMSSLAKLSQLRKLSIQIKLSNEFKNAIKQLIHLESFAGRLILTTLHSDLEIQGGEEERPMFSQLLVALSHLQQLTNLDLAPISQYPDDADSLSQLMSSEAPIFSRVTDFGFLCLSINFEVIGTLNQLGSKFPSLTAFKFVQEVCFRHSFSEDMKTHWKEEFQVHFHAALDSVRATLTSVTLDWPFYHPLKFVSTPGEEVSDKKIMSKLSKQKNKFKSKYSPVVAGLGKSKRTPLRLKSVLVSMNGIYPAIYTEPEKFLSTFVRPLTYLRRVDLNFNSISVLTEYTTVMLCPLVTLRHLDELSIMNLGLVTAEIAQQYTFTLEPSFIKQRDSHRPLKVVHITPWQTQESNANLQISMHILLLVLPRVDTMRINQCQMSMESLFHLAQSRPVVWSPQIDFTDHDTATVLAEGETAVSFRLEHLQTLPLDGNYLTAAEDVTALKLRTVEECPPPQQWWNPIRRAIVPPVSSHPHGLPHDGLVSILNTLSHDYTNSTREQHALLEDLNEFAFDRCQQLEFNSVSFTSVSPQRWGLDTILGEFVGIWRDEIFATTYKNRNQDNRRRYELFRLLREMQLH